MSAEPTIIGRIEIFSCRTLKQSFDLVARTG
jgi:hypothetical protein